MMTTYQRIRHSAVANALRGRMMNVRRTLRSAEALRQSNRIHRAAVPVPITFSRCLSSQHHDYDEDAETAAATTGKEQLMQQSTSSELESGPKTVSSSSSSSAASDRIIDVSPLADQMRARVRQYTQALRDAGKGQVRLVGILANEGFDRQRHNNTAEMYSHRIARTFAEDGLSYEVFRCSVTSRSQVEAVIQQMNARNDVHGILVFYPIFKELPKSVLEDKAAAAAVPKTYISRSGVYYKTGDDYLRDVVDPSKDVEGVSTTHRKMFRARHRQQARHKSNNDHHSNVVTNGVYVPCTALAVTRILDAYAVPPTSSPTSSLSGPTLLDPTDTSFTTSESQKWAGYTVTILNRSEILGRPLAGLLALQGATVYSVDEHSILVFDGKTGRTRRCSPHVTKEECLAQSSMIVTGVPKPDFCLDVSVIPEHAVVINVSGFPNVDEQALLQRLQPVTFVPQVGKVTVAALEENLIRLHRQRQSGGA